MTFQELAKANLSRARRWHKGGLEEWSPSDWAVAMMGEAGEACNAIKKLKRVEDGIANLSADPKRQIDTREAAIAVVAEELADTAIYLDLLCLRLGIDLSSAIRAKFNKVSERYDFPERL